MNEIALSLDIEDWYHTPWITGSSYSKYKTTGDFYKDWNDTYDLITKPTIWLFETFESLKIKATFFIVADILEKYPVISESLKASNHEIGCHGLYHEIPIDVSSKEQIIQSSDWKVQIQTAKTKLESVFQREVIGYRAPGGYFANWMVDLLLESGYKYDSSIAFNSIYNKTNVRLRNIPTCPYKLNNTLLNNYEPRCELLELPWSNFQIRNFKLPGGGAFFFRLLGYSYFKRLTDQNLLKGDTMFYFHPLDLVNERFPLNNFLKRPFYWVNKGNVFKKRLLKYLNHYQNQLTSCSSIYYKHQNIPC